MNHFSLFTGSGIGDYAAEQCGFETVAQCENDPACLFCLSRMFPDAKRFSDIKSITDDDVRRLGRIDLISGGFPCQDISSAGKGAGLDGDRSSLWFEMLRIINVARPAWLLIENVPALRVRGADRVLVGLEESGYTCWPHVVGAWAVGLQVEAQRLWIVAASNCERRKEVTNETSPFTAEENNGGGTEQFGGGCSGGVGTGERVRYPGCAEFSGSVIEWPVCNGVNGVAGGVQREANAACIRMAGNGWCFPVALMFFQWIAEQIQAETIA